MKREHQEQLLKDFPEFFDYLGEDNKIKTTDNVVEAVSELINQESIVLPMQFGFEIGDGWYWLLRKTFKTIHDYCKWNKKDFPHIMQVKEKYGMLDINCGSNEMVHGMVWFAEHLSRDICETCGTNVNVGQTQGWIYTICGSCREKNPRAKELEWKANE